MTGPRAIGAIVRDRQLRAYFQCCCRLRGRPAGEGAPQSLVTAFIFLEHAGGQAQRQGPIAAAAKGALSALRGPSVIERAYSRQTQHPEPPPRGAA